MSPLSLDAVGVGLFAERMVLARASGAWRRRVAREETIEFAPAAPGVPQWQPAVDALAAQAASGVFARARVTLVLSNRFVRYALVPASAALAAEEEMLALARHRIAHACGSDDDQWEARLSPGAPGESRLACAIERKLLDALQACMRPLGGRYASLQPHLMASFNRVRSRLGRNAVWLAVAEPGMLCLALLEDAAWRSVHAFKVGADWDSELPEILDRELCLMEGETDCDRVVVFAPESPPLALPRASKWRFAQLRAGVPAGAGAAFAEGGG